MGLPTREHRPLLAGLRIHRGSTVVGVDFPGNSFGTLTGLATRRSDGQRVLVTNLHVMASDMRNPDAGVAMYQPGPRIPFLDTRYIVGRNLSWIDVMEEGLDVALVELDSDVEASFEVHNPDHRLIYLPFGSVNESLGTVMPGAIEPTICMNVIIVGGTSGIIRAEVTNLNLAAGIIDESGGRYNYENWIGLSTRFGDTMQDGDSGGPVLYEESPGNFRMGGIVSGPAGSSIFATRANTVESALGITFGYQPEITTRSEENMGIPILTSDGFVGQRWIVDDYFRAGETLYAGDIVCVKQDAISRGSHPRVFKVTSAGEVRRIVGIVHTQAGKQVGDQVATTGATVAQDEFVPIVVQGVAQALSAVALGVGDPVTPSANSGTPSGKSQLVARVGAVTTNRDTYIGRCLSVTPGPNQVADILVDIAGGYDSALPDVSVPARTAFNAPTNLQVTALTLGGRLGVTWEDPSGFDRDRDYYQVQYRENDDNAAWRPTAAIQTSFPSATIGPLPAIAHQVQVRAVYNDSEGINEDSSDWVAAVGTPANNLPVANAGLDRTADTGVTVTLQGSATDLDGDAFTYLWGQTEGPTVTLSDSRVARPTFTAPATPTTLRFRLTVTDTHNGIDTDTVTIEVQELTPASNDATLSALGITPSSVTLVPAFTGATESYTASVDNAVANVRVTPTVNQPNATVRVSGGTLNNVAVTSGQQSGPINLNVGVSTITVVVMAQDRTTTKTYTVMVTRASLPPPPINRPPTANAGFDQTVRTGGSVQLFGTGSPHDPDEDATYHWSQVSGTTVTLSASANSATFTAPATPGTLVFRLTVTDERNVSASDDVTITVAANRAPTANAGSDQTVDTGERVFLIGSGADLDSGETLTYSWTQIGTPAVTLSNASSAVAYFTTPTTSATLVFRLTVSDGSLSGTDDVTITVQAPATPFLSSIVCEGRGITFNSATSTLGIFLNLAVDFNLDDGAGSITTETRTSVCECTESLTQ